LRRRFEDLGYEVTGFSRNVAADYWLGSVSFMDVLAARGLASPNMIKMAVEGAEIATLQGFDFEALRPKFVLMEAQPE